MESLHGAHHPGETGAALSKAIDIAESVELENNTKILPETAKTEKSTGDNSALTQEKHHRKAKVSQKQSRDENVMETNNSSIVSKRSVERLYLYQPHFLRYFVKRPIRRSPLINRGYWLRMHAVETVLSNFLEQSTEKKKVVVNLGCGYDPLPFKYLSIDEHRNGLTFVDVDYPELMSRKKDVIMQHHEMKDLISPVQTDPGDPAVVLCSDRYVAVGCDLRDNAKLSAILDEKLNLGSCLVLCIAEVSLTYMDVDSADALIGWAAQYDDIKFCLLEQCLPDGDKHPFAQKMLQHFDNLNTPLRCVHTYPALEDQESRFRKAGYHSARARTLWDLWQDKSFVGPWLRSRLDKSEPFDEWEEFALFSMHYLLLEAVKSPEAPSPDKVAHPFPNLQKFNPQFRVVVEKKDNPQALSSSNDGRRRKFAALTSFSGNRIGLYGGVGSEKRMQTTDRYRLSGAPIDYRRKPDPPLNIPARACHTITRLNDGRDIVVGGRTSPDNALSGCWLRGSDGWKAIQHLPKPLYRHCAAAVTLGEKNDVAGVLVSGGRSTGGIINGEWYLWRETRGWDSLPTAWADEGDHEPRFGASMAVTDKRHGLLFGGMTEQGILSDVIWQWNLQDEYGSTPLLRLMCFEAFRLAPRMGACLVPTSAGWFLIGGVSRSLLGQEEEIVCIRDVSHEETRFLQGEVVPVTKSTTVVSPVMLNFGSSRPLLVGHAAHAAGSILLIVGGGAVCFSFGAHWNMDIWTMPFSADGRVESSTQRWVADEHVPPDVCPRDNGRMELSSVPTRKQVVQEDIRRLKVNTAEEFNEWMTLARPFVMEGLDIGHCTKEWTPEELGYRLDPQRIVTVHQAKDNNMNFQQKNFQYVKKPFGEFLTECLAGRKQYMRSLSAEKPADQPANFHDDFPELRKDFYLPKQLATVSRNQHSSPLRISGPVNMWLHYDVMANVLCQIRGTKVVALYPPADALHFFIPPGSSTSPVHIFGDDDLGRGIITTASRPCIRATLRPGDVLYIPPLWLHAVCPMENLSVSINVFFRNLKRGYAAGRDVYGHRDLEPYENCRRGIGKMVKAFDGLPREIGSTYLERLAEELKDKARDLKDERG